jgi:DNA repair protein RadC
MKLPIYKLKLVRDGSVTYPPVSMKHPQLAALFFHRLIGQADREHAAALFLDAKGQPTGSSILSMGSLTFTPLPAREVFKAALLTNAFSLILAHNHPSNNSKPSHRDVEATKDLIRAGDILGVRVLDHIVITPSGSFTSMREAGMLTPWWPELDGLQTTPAVPKTTGANSYNSTRD